MLAHTDKTLLSQLELYEENAAAIQGNMPYQKGLKIIFEKAAKATRTKLSEPPPIFRPRIQSHLENDRHIQMADAVLSLFQEIKKMELFLNEGVQKPYWPWEAEQPSPAEQRPIVERAKACAQVEIEGLGLQGLLEGQEYYLARGQRYHHSRSGDTIPIPPRYIPESRAAKGLYDPDGLRQEQKADERSELLMIWGVVTSLFAAVAVVGMLVSKEAGQGTKDCLPKAVVEPAGLYLR